MSGGTRHLYLIDGSGYIFRAYHALPPLTRADGTPVGAVLGYCNILFKLLQETDADHIAVVFDAAGTSFRNKIYDQYKAHRPEPPPDLVPQFKLVREATDAFCVARIERADYEADDLIAAYARAAAREGATVTIVSSDKDLMQLVDDRVGMLDPIKQKPIGAAEVKEKFGVGPDKVVDVQALCGDSVDNVPGVPGIGVKTAAELINAYGDLETLLAHAAEIKQPKRRQSLIDFAEQARLSKRLVQLDVDAPMTLPLDELAVKPLDRARLAAFLRDNGFKNLLARVESKLAKGNGAAAAAPEALPAEPMAPPPTPDLRQVERRYALVQDIAELESWIAAAVAKGVVALAAETTSLNPAHAELVGLSLALEPGEACYVPLAHRANGTGELDLAAAPAAALKQIPLDAALARLKPLLEDEGVLKVGQDIKSAVELLAGYGIAVAPIDDTMLISFVLEGGLHGHDLDELAELHLGHDTIKYKDVAGSGKGHIGFAAVSLEKARDYAAEDADISLRLHRLLKPRLLAEHRLAFYETIERPLVRVVAQMEHAGIRVDRAELNRLSQDFAGRLAELEQEIHRLAGHPFNIGSPKQLGEVLFDELALGGGRKNKTGAYGTDAAVLEQLALTHDLPARVLDWRQLAKLKSTYADALIEEINPRTGRVHTCFSLAGADHRPALLDRAQPAEHPDPHRGGPQDPPRLRRRAGPCAALRRLQPDRAAPGRAHGRCRAAEGGVPRRRRHPCADRQRGVRRADGRDDGRDPPPRQGDQFRHPLRHERLRPGAAHPGAAGRGGGVHQGLFRPLPRHPRLYGALQGAVPRARLCRDPVRPALLSPRHQGRQPGAARLCRARGDQRAAAGHRRRHHQARHDPHSRGAGPRGPCGAHAAAGP